MTVWRAVASPSMVSWECRNVEGSHPDGRGLQFHSEGWYSSAGSVATAGLVHRGTSADPCRLPT